MTHYVDEYGRRIDLDAPPISGIRRMRVMRRCGRVHDTAVCAECRAIEDEQRREQHRRRYARVTGRLGR